MLSPLLLALLPSISLHRAASVAARTSRHITRHTQNLVAQVTDEEVWHLREHAHTMTQSKIEQRLKSHYLHYICLYVRAADGGAGENLAVTPQFGRK